MMAATVDRTEATIGQRALELVRKYGPIFALIGFGVAVGSL